MKRNTILLVQPRLGFSGQVVRHVPLSLLYAASESIQRGHRVELMDLRLLGRRWKEDLRNRMSRGDLLLVGITVMTGIPIANAVDVSRMAHREFSLPVVWGGPHPTVAAEEVLDEGAADFVVRGYGSRALADLADHLNGGGPPLSEISGLSFRRGEELVNNPTAGVYEHLHFRDIPYHLLDPDIESYMLQGKVRSFPLYSSHGCRSRCSFCISSVLYRGFRSLWHPVAAGEVLEQMALLQKRWGINYFYLYDDDSFAEPGHILGILRAAAARFPGVQFGFRGIRVDRILDLEDRDLQLLGRAGGHLLHVGVESGSDRVLRLLNKGITVEQSIAANHRLAAIPGLTAGYNWLLAVPGETMSDLRQTRDLMLRLAKENPRTICFHPNRFIPLPGTSLFREAVAQGFVRPKTLVQWSRLDSELVYNSPWLSEEANRFVHLLQLASYFIDGRAALVRSHLPRLGIVFPLIRTLYRPLLDLRLEREWSSWLIEMGVMSALKRVSRGC